MVRRCAFRSSYTRPEHTRMRLTFFGWTAVSVSPITVWNAASASSLNWLTASLWRNRDFGVKTTRGFRSRRIICRRSRWNICAGVVGCTDLGQFAQLAYRFLMAQQRLRREDNQRFPKQADHLPAQQMEHLRRRSRLHRLHIVIGAQLQETLDARR